MGLHSKSFAGQHPQINVRDYFTIANLAASLFLRVERKAKNTAKSYLHTTPGCDTLDHNMQDKLL